MPNSTRQSLKPGNTKISNRLLASNRRLTSPNAQPAANPCQQKRQENERINPVKKTIRQIFGLGLLRGDFCACFRTNMILASENLLAAIPTQGLAAAFAINDCHFI
jgi:hypothetical protein